MDINKAIIIGRLGRDPDIRQTRDGRAVASFSVATGKRWKDKETGEKKEVTHWHNVVVFNENLAKVVEQHARKGSRVYVEGEMQTRKWTDQQGVDRWVTEIVLSGFKGELQLLDRAEGAGRPPPSDGEDDYGTRKDPGSNGTGGAQPQSRDRDLDDEIPF